jgi:hypothetical protein
MQRYMLRAMSSTKMELDLVPWRSPRYSIKTSRRCQRQSASWLRFHNDRGRNTTFCILNFDVIKRRQRTANIVFGTIKANGELETKKTATKASSPPAKLHLTTWFEEPFPLGGAAGSTATGFASRSHLRLSACPVVHAARCALRAVLLCSHHQPQL